MIAAKPAIKRIFVIEDDLAAATLIQEALQLEGDSSWTVEVITDGAAAVKAIQQSPPDLVLLDLRLPGADGGTIFRYLRQHPKTLKLPILFISGATSHELHDSGIEDGVLLRKPVNLGILLHVVRTHLQVA
jgi:two-component system sensor histidine kinase/response regulator